MACLEGEYHISAMSGLAENLRRQVISQALVSASNGVEPVFALHVSTHVSLLNQIPLIHMASFC